MLSLISTADAAARTCASGAAAMHVRPRQAAGAAPFGSGVAGLRARAEMRPVRELATSGLVTVDPAVTPWPQASAQAEFSGYGTHAAAQALSAGQQLITNKFADTIRIAAAGGGALGPHPAREPV